jgi:hypothetical protein
VDNSESLAVCLLFQQVEGPFYRVGVRWSAEAAGARHGPDLPPFVVWAVLMLAPWSVVSRYPGLVPLDSTLRWCGCISWSGRIYSKSCDAPPLVGTAQDCFGVAVGCMHKWARGSNCLFSHPLDQTDITTANPIHSKCVCGSGNRLDSNRGGVQVRPHQQGRPYVLVRPHQQGQPHLLVRPHLPGVALWLIFIPKCIPTSKNTNTTRGTLLVLKTCMKLVIYPPRF